MSKKEWIIISVIAFFTIVAFSNIFKADFVFLDDYSLIVNNEDIKNFGTALGSLNIDNILNSLVYSFFGMNSTAFHFINVVIHLINVFLAYISIKKIFDIKTAYISAFLFSVHPVNTEAISWISGKGHLINTTFFLITLLTYLNERTNSKSKFPLKTVGILSIFSILRMSVWAGVIPITLVVIAFFLLRENPKKIKNLFILFIPVGFMVLLSGNKINPQNRLPYMFDEEKSAIGTYRNQEKLKPIVEGGPYTIYSMIRLYIFPKNLNIYYDGVPITQETKLYMYSATLFYGTLLGYFIYIKSWKIVGVLLLLLAPLAPTFSPIKVTWYMAERYLYLGNIFFCTLLSMGIIYLEKHYKKYYLTLFVLTLLGISYSYRTYIRNKDWQSTITLAKASIETSPQSVRAYNDMGNGYMLNENYDEALIWYNKSLKIDKYSNSAIKNIGLAIVKGGTSYLSKQQEMQTIEYSDEEILESAEIFYNNKNDLKAVFYITQLLKKYPEELSATEALADIYLRAQNFDSAREMYIKIYESSPENERILLNLGYIEYVTENYENALNYLNEAIRVNPNNPNTLEYISLVEKELNKN